MTLRRTLVRSLVVGISLLSVMVAAALVPTDDAKARAEGWARGLTEAKVQHYIQPDSLVGLPVDYRTAVFARLTRAGDRAAFWKSVFAAYRRQHQLTVTQTSLLDKAEVLLPAVFRTTKSERSALHAQLIALSDEIGTALGPEAKRELFRTAGPSDHMEALPATERVLITMRNWSHTSVVARALSRLAPGLTADEWTCNCSSEAGTGRNEGDCHYEQHCTQDLNSCTHTGGCNCFLIIFDCWTCDGLCNYGIEG